MMADHKRSLAWYPRLKEASATEKTIGGLLAGAGSALDGY